MQSTTEVNFEKPEKKVKSTCEVYKAVLHENVVEVFNEFKTVTAIFDHNPFFNGVYYYGCMNYETKTLELYGPVPSRLYW